MLKWKNMWTIKILQQVFLCVSLLKEKITREPGLHRHPLETPSLIPVVISGDEQRPPHCLRRDRLTCPLPSWTPLPREVTRPHEGTATDGNLDPAPYAEENALKNEKRIEGLVPWAHTSATSRHRYSPTCMSTGLQDAPPNWLNRCASQADW